MNHAMTKQTERGIEKAANPAGSRLKADLERYGEGIAALASGLLIGVAWTLSGYSERASIVFYVLAFLVGGFAKAKEGWETLIQDKELDVNLLMIVAAIGAASIGYWTEGAVLIFIFSLSGALETYTMNRSSRDISSLMGLKPETAVLYTDEGETVVPIESLNVGDVVLVRPGERIPADGFIREGTSSVNQSSITGESLPVDKGAGDEVFAGTLNGQGALFVEVSRRSDSTLFAKMIRLVQEAQSEKPATQRFIEKLERVYVRIVLIATALLIAVPPLLLGYSWESTFYKAMVFLVVASPCALVASIMPAVLSAISTGARHGLLFKGGAHVDHIAGVKAVAFDKTGTLTEGKPVVTDLVGWGEFSEKEVLRIAASMESLSEHPLARAIVKEAEENRVELRRPSDFQALTGWGVQAEMDGEVWKLGKADYVEERLRTPELADLVSRLEGQGKTVTVLHRESGVAGIIALRDAVRPEAKSAVARLRGMGIEVAMLTGDSRRTAAAIADELGIERVYSELLPEDKVAKVKELGASRGSVAMVGDGVNDAPALAVASVGIAMGGAGSDAALETADVVLMNDDIGRIADAVELGQRTRRIVKQNIVFALSVIVLLIVGNFAQGIALPLGVVGHEGSTILVILNGLRLLGNGRMRRAERTAAVNVKG
ncbi:heavy metal translocating P-type ATPase [Cohnella thailandensis]|uniref:Cadmium-translocating P-type ATPase n=1 Tax=Cohnella thailandensis TaxID=557557 RepID=A0A841T4E7_9BACL|nr:heavy metal translocating P-type ATPase [Cohnella thailandensis]MBB6636001.1 cadmium-translocating P-type ATPase [Cohnella thailandensis]MBP1976379.1 Cd2+/Zn2+-exporting ATPase [Cohnella thailandensis]